MNRILTDEKEVKEAIKNGVNTLANAVKKTLGAKGRNAMLIRPSMLPVITKDGVSVAKEITLNCPVENAAALALKQVAANTADSAGDGTTTSIVLAQAIVEESYKRIDEGSNPIELKKGIDYACKMAVRYMQRKLAKQVNNDNTLRNIAKISANGDEEIADSILSAIKEVGKDGVIKFEESSLPKTELQINKGYYFDCGYLSPYFINNHEKFEVQYENAVILLYNSYLKEPKELQKVVNSLNGRPLVIISDNIDSHLLSILIQKQTHGQMTVAAVKSPEFGANRLEVMEDLATFTGGSIFGGEKYPELDVFEESHFGKAKKVVIGKDGTFIFGGDGKEETVKKQVEKLQAQKENTKNKKDIDFIKDRIAKLSKGIATLKVGGMSEPEMKEKVDRVEDAICAVKSSLKEGYVIGGGVTYLTLSKFLSTLNPIDPTLKEGIDILKESLRYPFLQIMENASYLETGKESVEMILEKKYGYGFNVKTLEFGDLKKAGVFDSAKVARTALENASSIASTFLTTSVIVYNDEQLF